MPNWITLKGTDVRLLQTEETIMGQASPTHTLDDCVASAMNIARGYVAGAANPLEPQGVPPETVDDVIAIARASYLAQDPTATLLTPQRQKERDNAYLHLRDVAKELSWVTPADLSTTTPEQERRYGTWGSVQQLVMRTDPQVPPPAATPATPNMIYVGPNSRFVDCGPLAGIRLEVFNPATQTWIIQVEYAYPSPP